MFFFKEDAEEEKKEEIDSVHVESGREKNARTNGCMHRLIVNDCLSLLDETVQMHFEILEEKCFSIDI